MKLKNSSTKPVAEHKVRFNFVNALRGIAALWVLLFHAAQNERLVILRNLLPHWFEVVVFDWGKLGVAIFFVLSGFVIAHSLRGSKIDSAFFKSFCLRRFARLNPPYYVSIVIFIAFGLISSYIKGEPFTLEKEPLSLQRLITHLFYVQGFFHQKSISDVYWTLCFEVQFYLVFCVMLGLAQQLNYSFNFCFGQLAVFAPAAVIAALSPLGLYGYNDEIIFLSLWYSFLLGLFAYWSWYDRLEPKLFYFYCFLLLAAGIIRESNFTIVSVITAVFLLKIGQANRMQTFLNWGWLQFLGNISYSFYLIHALILNTVFFSMYKFFNRSFFTEIISLVVSIFASVGFANIMWHLVEKPSIKWSQNLK